MCGIVGYSGPQNAIIPVLEGLTRLEYRGYDSAGVSYLVNNEIQIIKKEGKIDNLKAEIKNKNPFSHTAIGHTRWATHGAVNELNAHPHTNETFSIVHNGIIENASEIKEDLQKEGFKFKSDTDSEVFLVLLTKYFLQTKSVKDSISLAMKLIRGNSAFVMMMKDSTSLYAVKRGAPLVAGNNPAKKEIYLSSDPYALIGFAENIYFPEDEVICELNRTDKDIEVKFFELSGQKSERYKAQAKKMSLDVANKGEHEHFMLKEIYEQPGLIKNLYEYYLNQEGRQLLTKITKYKPDFIHIIGCGTAWHAGLVIKNFFEEQNKVRVNVELASEFRYRNPILKKNDIGIFISQSGETADTLASCDLCIEEKVTALSIVNVEGSTLYRNCAENFLIKAGLEIGVASTKAFTMQVLTGYLMSLSMAGKLEAKKVQKEFDLLADNIKQVLSRTTEIKAIADAVYNKKGFIFTGRGIYFPIALEGALKLKEIAYVHAEGYAAGELKHGPIALIDQHMVNISIVGPELHEKALSNTEEVKSRRGLIIGIGDEKDKKLKGVSDYYFGMNLEGLDHLRPVLVNISMQLFAYYVAKLKGTDIDKPRNLAKSVTVE
ncbi:MAG: glutamine--fructose-6-phosphate transaminase (isomerizing) [Bacteriovoracaceae bacterium]|nr:glutamine--fructose-6-phosphate transaminase (isomerizing) [Bacteriovoracaceae bacterium]